jgi:hypothetical protein
MAAWNWDEPGLIPAGMEYPNMWSPEPRLLPVPEK